MLLLVVGDIGYPEVMIVLPVNVSVLFNAESLKTKSFVAYFIHTMECVYTCLPFPNMDFLCYRNKVIKLMILLYQVQ